MEYFNSGCTILSSLNSSKLLDYLLMVNDCDFVYRSLLNLNLRISFGNEIEVNDVDLEKAEELVYYFNNRYNLNGNKKFIAHEELTAGSEVVTPIMYDDEDDWDNLYNAYTMLKYTGATIGNNTANHIHVGTNLINTPQLLSLLLKTLVVFEPIIFKFGYGYDDTPRNFIKGSFIYSNYAMMASPKRYKDFINGLKKYSYSDKNRMDELFKQFLNPDLNFRPAFNFNNFDFSKLFYNLSVDKANEADNLEIRCFNGTLEPVIAQNNINLITHIIEAVVMGKIDIKYIEEEYKKYRKKTYNFDVWRAVMTSEKEATRYNRLLDGFSNVRMDKAIKLADMIFDNDIDKIYFLKQYLKLFQVSEEEVFRLVK